MGNAATAINLATGIDQRNQQRWALVNHLKVYNDTKGEMLGHLLDLTTEGIKLISEAPIAVESEFNLTMELPNDDDQYQHISFKARSIWSKPDSDPHFHYTGLQLIDAEESVVATLGELIEKLRRFDTKE